MLVCDRHTGNPENTALLMRYKRNFVDKYSKELPEFSKNIKISMYSAYNCANIGVSQVAATQDIVGNRGLFMLQTITVEGQLFNLFYESGCGDLVCKKSAIDKLVNMGRANQELPGPITLSGVGDKKTVCQDGVYKISLPLEGGKEAVMSGLCLDKVTGTFPVFPLGRVEDEIEEQHQHFGNVPTGKLPRLPEKVGGETDIMIWIKYMKYFPKEIYHLPDDLAIYEAVFRNSDGSKGVAAGPHPVFPENCVKSVAVYAHSYEAIPQLIQYRRIHNLDMDVPLLANKSMLVDPEANPELKLTALANASVLAVRRPPKNSQIFDKIEDAETDVRIAGIVPNAGKAID